MSTWSPRRRRPGDAMRSPNAFQLTDREAQALVRSRSRVMANLQAAGIRKGELAGLVQLDFQDVFERKSAACPYEQLRARRLVSCAINSASWSSQPAVFLTLGSPRERVPIDRLVDVDFRKLKRKWRRGIRILRSKNPKLKGFCVFEVQVCKPVVGDMFQEPHLHAVLWGAPRLEVFAAFQVQVPKGETLRRRATHTDMVDDLSGAVGYCLKFSPKMMVQYEGERAKPWQENHQPVEHEAHWHAHYARFRIADFLSFAGFAIPDLNRPNSAEMALPRGSRLR